MSCSPQNFLAAGHISSFQIHSKYEMRFTAARSAVTIAGTTPEMERSCAHYFIVSLLLSTVAL